MKRFDFHFSKSQGVVIASPVSPLHTVSVRRVTTTQVGAVQVGVVTLAVPPATFVHHSARAPGMRIVVLVSSAELASEMIPQRVTF